MTFDASHALRFINRARAATGLPALSELPFTGAVRVDERACLLARALQAEVGGSADPRFRDGFVVRLGDWALARAVASRTGQPCNDRAEVLLPDPLARLAVAFDRGQVERRGARYVAPGQLSFDDLETAGCQAAAVVGDSPAGHSTKAEHRSSLFAGSWPARFPGRFRDHSASSSTTSSGTGDAGGGHPAATADGGSEAQAVPRTERPRAYARPRSQPPEPRRDAVTASPARPRTVAVPCRASRRAQAERSWSASRAATRPPLSRGRRGPAPAPIEQALSAVHHHTISAAHGGRAGGQRTRAERTPPGPPGPHDDSLHPNWMPFSRPLRTVPRHAAPCFKRRLPCGRMRSSFKVEGSRRIHG